MSYSVSRDRSISVPTAPNYDMHSWIPMHHFLGHDYWALLPEERISKQYTANLTEGKAERSTFPDIPVRFHPHSASSETGSRIYIERNSHLPFPPPLAQRSPNANDFSSKDKTTLYHPALLSIQHYARSSVPCSLEVRNNGTWSEIIRHSGCGSAAC